MLPRLDEITSRLQSPTPCHCPTNQPGCVAGHLIQYDSGNSLHIKLLLDILAVCLDSRRFNSKLAGNFGTGHISSDKLHQFSIAQPTADILLSVLGERAPLLNICDRSLGSSSRVSCGKAPRTGYSQTSEKPTLRYHLARGAPSRVSPSPLCDRCLPIRCGAEFRRRFDWHRTTVRPLATTGQLLRHARDPPARVRLSRRHATPRGMNHSCVIPNPSVRRPFQIRVAFAGRSSHSSTVVGKRPTAIIASIPLRRPLPDHCVNCEYDRHPAVPSHRHCRP